MDALLGVANPFGDSICGDAWDPPRSTVEAIHQGPLALCRQLVDQVRATGATTSLLIDGEAGSGKTHLVARLRRELTGGWEPRAAGPARPVIFCWVRLDLSAGRLW